MKLIVELSNKNLVKKYLKFNKISYFIIGFEGLSFNACTKFSIDEIQTQNGYIIFSAANNKYLATIAGIDADNSILKITPCNEIYFLNLFTLSTNETLKSNNPHIFLSRSSNL